MTVEAIKNKSSHLYLYSALYNADCLKVALPNRILLNMKVKPVAVCYVLYIVMTTRWHTVSNL